MNIDRSLMVTLLSILKEQRGLTCGTEEYALFSDVNLRASVPIATPFLREHIDWAEEHGWISWTLDSIRAKRWKITPAGVSQLDDLKNGG